MSVRRCPVVSIAFFLGTVAVLTPTACFTSRSSPTPARATACPAVRTIDWERATLRRGVLPVVSPDYKDRMTGPMRFEGGVYKWYLDRDEIELGEHYELVREDGVDQGPVAARSGDLDGDGCDEVALHVVDSGWGTNRSREALWIVAMVEGTATIVATIPGGDGDCFQFVASPEIRGGAIWTKRRTPIGDDADVARPETCGCGNLGGGIRAQRWVWQGNRLVEDRRARGFARGPDCG